MALVLCIPDTFSTRRDGTPIGNQKFAIVETETKEWRLDEEDYA